MKIAVPTSEGILDPHFGHCTEFTLFEIENDEVKEISRVNAPPHKPGMLPPWLAEKGVTGIIAGGMGHRAIEIFNSLGVDVYCGAPLMTPGELVDGFLKNTLRFSVNSCNH